MKVLVTGGAGLIGMALRRDLAAAGHQVVATDVTDFGRGDGALRMCDLADAAALMALAEGAGVEAIVHSGGVSGPAIIADQPRRIAEINIGSTASLLEVARSLGARLLLLSSHVVYGQTGPDLIEEGRPLAPGSTYAASKVGGEALVGSFRREFGLSAASLRLTRVYGTWRRANCPLRQVLIDVAAGRETTLIRDAVLPYHYLYVCDISAAVIAALAAPELRHSAYNIGSGEVLLVDEMAQIIGAVLPSARLRMVPGVDPAPEYQADFSLRRIEEDAGWRPAWPLARGLADYAAQVARDPKAAG